MRITTGLHYATLARSIQYLKTTGFRHSAIERKFDPVGKSRFVQKKDQVAVNRDEVSLSECGGSMVSRGDLRMVAHHRSRRIHAESPLCGDPGRLDGEP